MVIGLLLPGHGEVDADVPDPAGGSGGGGDGVAGAAPASGLVAEFVDDEFGLVVVPQFGVAFGASPDGALFAQEAHGDGEPAALGGDVAAVAVLVGVAA